MPLPMELEEQYDKIYRYCYFKLHQQQAAEDAAQEVFLRFWSSAAYQENGQALRYLYTIARNLCIDELHRHKPELLPDGALNDWPDRPQEDGTLTRVALQEALGRLDEADRELLLLRYVNEVPVTVLCRLYGMSRFTLYRRCTRLLRQLREELGEDFV